MSRPRMFVAAALIAAAGFTAQAQTAQYRARLSPVPLDVAMQATIAGGVTCADQVRPVGGIAARWSTLESVMDVGTIDMSEPRARQLRDEPQSGRYPTRGYQQRQQTFFAGPR